MARNTARSLDVCFRAQHYTLFRIDKSRLEGPGRGVGHGVRRRAGLRLLHALPQVHARGSDVLVQFRLPWYDLIREREVSLGCCPAAEERQVDKQQQYGAAGIVRRGPSTRQVDGGRFSQPLEAARQQVVKDRHDLVCRELEMRAELRAKRFREHGEAYFRFITTPGIEPTNNLAERSDPLCGDRPADNDGHAERDLAAAGASGSSTDHRHGGPSRGVRSSSFLLRTPSMPASMAGSTLPAPAVRSRIATPSDLISPFRPPPCGSLPVTP